MTDTAGGGRELSWVLAAVLAGVARGAAAITVDTGPAEAAVTAAGALP